jgi:hypothetical protein
MKVSAGLTALAVLGSAMSLAVAQDLDADKSPQQLFTLNCVACHQSPRGLAKRAGPGLASFLREHYTSGPPTAAALAGYLNSIGGAASDARETTRPKTSEPPLATPTRIRPGEDRKRKDEKATAKHEDERNERQQRRAEREAERAARMRVQERTTGVPVGLTRSYGGPRRRYGEPAIVETDPPAVEVTTAPIPTPPLLLAIHAAAPRSPKPSAAVAPTRVSVPPTPAVPAEPRGPAATLTVIPPAPRPAMAPGPAVNPQTPAASVPTVKAETSGSAPPTPQQPAKAETNDKLPAYPPPLDLELKAPADAAQKPAAQSGFSSPVP